MREIHDSTDFPVAWLATPPDPDSFLADLERQTCAIARRKRLAWKASEREAYHADY